MQVIHRRRKIDREMYKRAGSVHFNFRAIVFAYLALLHNKDCNRVYALKHGQ